MGGCGDTRCDSQRKTVLLSQEDGLSPEGGHPPHVSAVSKLRRPVDGVCGSVCVYVGVFTVPALSQSVLWPHISHHFVCDWGPFSPGIEFT